MCVCVRACALECARQGGSGWRKRETERKREREPSAGLKVQVEISACVRVCVRV